MDMITPGEGQPDPLPCWHCGAGVAARALFCHQCGAIQPPGDVDPFTRLGLLPSFEIETATLDRQAAGFARILDPSRFAARGEEAQAIAARQRDALTHAIASLRDPAARARALLTLADAAPAKPRNGGAWELRLAVVTDGPSLARLVTEVKTDMQAELRLLLDAFRLRDLSLAATRLRRVEEMALALTAAEGRR
ncbi:molecular chaperone DnaJ [Niveispirillum irakense]|uniref:molecular chaperone DnaJ n=1 Tax=Niveispirillum irakense TaxID=34011 RepID=UPI000406137A|nr:molecular chaperone DnaJ [Niveispirillum irakense]